MSASGICPQQETQSNRVCHGMQQETCRLPCDASSVDVPSCLFEASGPLRGQTAEQCLRAHNVLKATLSSSSNGSIMACRPGHSLQRPLPLSPASSCFPGSVPPS